LTTHFSKLAEQTEKWVVNISTTKRIRTLPPQLQGVPPEILRFFFGIDPRQLNKRGPQEEVHSLGSGFIISTDGYILTNNHVVEGADDIIVRMSDRREFKAKLVGRDKATDVALLKIEVDNLPAARIGTSRTLKVGQWVLAIGQPFGLDFTVTHGIVSAKGRSLPDENYVPFIQTDVPINPGNSGGPLINMRGEVVGINAQIFSKSGGYMGLSFAIPIEIAMNVADQLMKKGKVERGFLGVTIQEVNADLATAFGMKRPYGALVAEVGKGTPAEKAGIRAGDIIIEYDGHSIEKSTDLPPLVGVTPIGKRVKIVILREGKKQILTAHVTQKPSAEAARQSGAQTPAEMNFGAIVEDLAPPELQKLGAPYGVRVVDVIGGPAARSGLQPGDVIVSIAFRPVKSAAQLEQILSRLPKGRKFPMRIVRRGASLFLPLVME
jgi:serine protease Do